MSIQQQISEYVDKHADSLIKELQIFLQQPSISTENIGMEECTKMLQKELEKLDMNNQMLTVEGAFPAVFGTSKKKSDGRELLIYGHYDVQSPDPIDKWTYPPFSAEIHDGLIYARGATDDKGNLFANLKAAETLKSILGEIPSGLKFFFEGEEEIGSPNLSKYLETYASELKCDVSIICDRGVHESGRPQFYLGNKGLIEVEISAKRAKRDVHSGHAPLINNALWDINRLLASMKNELEFVTIDNYYDNVCTPPEDEIELIKNIPYNLDQFRSEYKIPHIIGDETDPVDVIKRLIYTPTCNISGIHGGWCGERGKTIVPCEGWVRLDMRLVKNQTVAEAKEKIKAYVEKSPYGPFEIKMKGNNEPYQCPASHPAVQTSILLATEVYGEAPVVWPLLDGSGPMCMFPTYLGGENFIIGLGAPFSLANTHAPDENISIDQYLTGIKFMANLYYEYLK